MVPRLFIFNVHFYTFLSGFLFLTFIFYAFWPVLELTQFLKEKVSEQGPSENNEHERVRMILVFLLLGTSRVTTT